MRLWIPSVVTNDATAMGVRIGIIAAVELSPRACGASGTLQLSGLTTA